MDARPLNIKIAPPPLTWKNFVEANDAGSGAGRNVDRDPGSMSTFVFAGSRSTNFATSSRGYLPRIPRFVVLRTLDVVFEEALTKRRFITGEELDASMAQLQSTEAPWKGPNQAMRKTPCCKLDGTLPTDPFRTSMVGSGRNLREVDVSQRLPNR